MSVRAAAGNRRDFTARRLRFIVLLVLCVWTALGIRGTDEAALREFSQATQRWQAHAEFRSIAMEYCVRGSRTLQCRPLLLPAGGTVLALRSIPGLPKEFAVNPTSRAHYDSFSKGPLCAYLHLCSEQSVPMCAGILEATASRPDRPAGARQFLGSFHMDFPVCQDDGALQSVESVMRDTSARKPLVIRDNIGPMLIPHIRAIARELRFPEDPPEMTSDQQLAVLDRLDTQVRQNDPELWRTKQLNDFCGGVWAQVFGPSYRLLITPVLAIHAAAQFLLAVVVLWLGFRTLPRHRTNAAAAAMNGADHPTASDSAAPAPVSLRATLGRRPLEDVDG